MSIDDWCKTESDGVHVYHNAGDMLVEFSKLVPFHPWGDMGNVGYVGDDARVTNFDQANTAGLPVLNGHSDIFAHGKVRPWARFMAERCLEAVTRLTTLENRHV